MSRKETATGPEVADYSELMDLRVDYAFKLFFATGDTRHLVSLLNAIFGNKQIPRVVSSLTVVNPFLEKAALEDKLSVLDIRATLDDGTDVCIEMHMYDLEELKYKSLRSWARAYGEELQPGQEYRSQGAVICISLMDGPVTDAEGAPVGKVHSLFQAIERDSHEVLVGDMELHYINMKEFARHYNRAGGAHADQDMFTKWLVLITHKEIEDKEAIKEICAEGEIMDAMETLAELSKDKIARQAYQRRMDQLYFHNKRLAEQDAAMAEKDAALSEKDALIAEQDAALSEKDAALSEKDALIVELQAKLAEKA